MLPMQQLQQQNVFLLSVLYEVACPNTVSLALRDDQIGKVVIFQFSIQTRL